jgi:hypothetical protein
VQSGFRHAGLSKAGRSARGWYRQAGKLIGDVFGSEAPRFTALLAATSGNKGVDANIRIASVVWKHYKQLTGGMSRPLELTELRKLYNRLKPETNNLPHLKYTLAPVQGRPSADWINLARALTSSDPGILTEKLLAGPSAHKIDSFRKNLLGELHTATTLDTHIGRVLGVGKQLNGTKYLAAARHFQDTANYLNQTRKDDEESWTAADVQAATWAMWRTGVFLKGISHPESAFRFPANQARLDQVEQERNVSIPRNIRPSADVSKHVTHELVNGGVTFHNLLTKDPYVTSQLKAAGHDTKGRLAHQWMVQNLTAAASPTPTGSVTKGLTPDERRKVKEVMSTVGNYTGQVRRGTLAYAKNRRAVVPPPNSGWCPDSIERWSPSSYNSCS